MGKEWWEIALRIAALLCSHAACMIVAASLVRYHYEKKLIILRFRARIITGLDPTMPDERFPD